MAKLWEAASPVWAWRSTVATHRILIAARRMDQQMPAADGLACVRAMAVVVALAVLGLGPSSVHRIEALVG